jgi:ribosomal protein S18 acetylase RimI-like enzyme
MRGILSPLQPFLSRLKHIPEPRILFLFRKYPFKLHFWEFEMDFHVMTFWAAIMLISLVQADSSKLIYRNAQFHDLSAISKLLVETFDTGTPKWNLIARSIKESGYQSQLSQRMEQLVLGGAQHAMLVACDGEDVVAFAELGTMPSPVPVMQMWEGVETEMRPETPYLGNLAVSSAYRRKRIGRRMVKLVCKAAEKWSQDALWLAVDVDNFAAIRLYGGLDFDIIKDESEDIYSQRDRPPRVIFRKELRKAKLRTSDRKEDDK